jgi:hypothetical protein
MELTGVLNVFVALLGALVVWALSMLILVVIPGCLVLYVVRLFPLTGQWRARFKARFGRKP